MRITLLLLLTAGVLPAQETPFTRLKRESLRAQHLPLSTLKLDPLRERLKEWLDWRLPRSANSTTDFDQIETSMTGELKKAGILFTIPDDGINNSDIKYGFINLSFMEYPELPHSLLVVASVTVPCGLDDAVYLYHYDPAGRHLLFEDHPCGCGGYSGPQIDISEPDSQDRRLLATHYTSTQCWSSWMSMAYSVYRLSANTASVDLLLSDQHGFWFNEEDGPPFVLKPDELLIEFRDHSIDALIHNRVNIERFNFAEGVRRVDPVAFQPQDFAEEWLARPWSEMQSRSAASTQSWHDKLHKNWLMGSYDQVVQCTENPSRWLIGLDIDKGHRTWFLVHDLTNYRYEMESVGETKPQGCTGTGLSKDVGWDDKWLSAERLKALP